ncbi:SDR family NAD(P)-dependent oxidoreductase [Paenibacillus spongiae]|uniref:SDR family oxidoreductase n=1 Tax=Paenibacillus spongiae TaxID=2909671 RepID=A0ABY5SB50_9BACL|nr:SDR family NAD(P)-dependent oxidoreductase [Paenibacillus spongiae]UVI29995.1 SDR family oxidoreductase [Paenibacillus spongiae]
MRLQGKRALVTGGARGIGKGVVERYLAEGAKVIVMDRSEADLKETEAELTAAGYGDSVRFLVCDISEPELLTRQAAEAIGYWQGLDILVNNAGIAFRESFMDITPDHWNKVMNINLNAVFQLSQIAARQMIQQGTGGSIVNMSSKNGLAGSSMLAHYNTSKAGIILLTQSMAVELAPHAVRVNAVAPGFIDTPLDRGLREKEGLAPYSERTPMKRLGTIEEVANVFLFLASGESSYVTGTTITVDGGHMANASEV